MSEPKPGRLLIVDDEAELTAALCEILESEGYDPVAFNDPVMALAELEKDGFDLLIADLKMPSMDGITLLREALKVDPNLVGIIMTGQGTVRTAVDAMKHGAFDYVLKPVKATLLAPILARAMEVRRLRMENVQLREAMAVYELSRTVAHTLDHNVLLNKTAAAALRQLEADEASIMLPTPEGDELFIAAVEGKGREEILGSRVELGKSVAGWVARTRQPLSLEGEIRDPRFIPLYPRPEIRSAVSMPMVAGGKLLGVLNVNSLQHRSATPGQVKGLSILAGTAAAALESAGLYREVREAEEKYRAIFENTVEGIYQTTPGPAARFLTANPALARMCGYDSPEDLAVAVGNVDLMYVDPDRRVELVHRLDDEGSVAGFESRIYRKDGSHMWISENARAVKDLEGRSICYEGTWEDITTRRQAEEALEQRERYFRSLLFSMHEEILVIDRNLKIVDTNKSLMTPLERSRNGTIGRRCHEASHGRDDPCWNSGQECGLIEVFQTGLPRMARHEHVRPDGSMSWVDILYSPLKDEQGGVTHVIEAIRDVTQEVELQRQFRQAQKMEAIGTLAGGIAHDFNNILGVILGYAEISMFDQPEDTPLHENLSHIFTAAQRARDLVRQILTFSRQSEEERGPIRLGIIVKEALKMLRAVLPSTVEIRSVIEPAAGGGDLVMASLTQMHQVLMNLCGNAAHAMREAGGTLDVVLSSVDFTPTDSARPRGLEAGPYVRLVIGDTGHGMDKATMDRIFEPYFTTKELGEGTGLGLSVVHGIVKSHGGVITVRSEPGVGTTFEIYFPRLDSEIEAESGLVADVPSGGTERILFVDDEASLVDWGRRALERFGYEVHAATSSKDALEVFKIDPERFDLVITDLTMPHMTGIELTGKLVALRPDIPVILCTGFGDQVTQEKARAAGIRELILKPFIMTTMTKSIRRVLDSSRGAA